MDFVEWTVLSKKKTERKEKEKKGGTIFVSTFEIRRPKMQTREHAVQTEHPPLAAAWGATRRSSNTATRRFSSRVFRGTIMTHFGHFYCIAIQYDWLKMLQ